MSVQFLYFETASFFYFSFNFSQEFHSIVKSSRNQAMFDIFLKNNRINILLFQENILN